MKKKTPTQIYDELYPIGSSIERFALETHDQLSDQQLCDCSTAIHKLDWIISTAYREADSVLDPPVICMRNMDHRGLNDILRKRMKAYQERTGNKDNGGFPFFIVDIKPDASPMTEADMKYFKKNLLKSMNLPPAMINGFSKGITT